MKAILFFVAFAFLIVAQAESSAPSGGAIVKKIEVNLEHKIGQLRAQIANFRKVNKAQRVALRAQQERSREKRKANRATLKELQPKIDALKVKLAKAEQKVGPFEQEWNSITNQLARLRSRRDTAVRRINARIREQKWIRASLAATSAALKALQAKGATHKAALLEMPIEEATSFLEVAAEEVDAEAVAESDMNEEEQEEVLQEVDTAEEEEEAEEEETEDNSAEEAADEAEEAAEEAVELATAAEDEAEADEEEEENTSDLNQRFAEVMSQVATSTTVGNSLDDAIHEVQVLRETALNEINKLKQDREDVVTRFVREIKLAKERLNNLAPIAKAAIARRDNLKDRLKKARAKKFTLIAANKAYRANEDVIEKQVASLRLAVQAANKRFEKQEARLIAELAQVKKLENTLEQVEAAHGAVTVVTKKPAPASWRAGKWSECSQACGKGLKKREVKCVSFTGKPAPGQCVGSPRPAAVKKCQIKPCPSHCQVSAFSAWSKCTAVCTGKPRAYGTRIRTRTVVKASKFGGRKCPALTHEQPCVRHCTVNKNGLPVPAPVKAKAAAAAAKAKAVAKAAVKVAAPKAQPKAKAGSIAALPKVAAAKAKAAAAKAKVAAAKAKAKAADQKRKEQKEKHAAAQAKRVEAAKKLAEAKKKQEEVKKQLAELKKNAGKKDAETRAKIAALKAAVKAATKKLEESKARAKAAAKKEAKLKAALKEARNKSNKAKAAAIQAKIAAAKAQKKAAAIALKKGQEKLAKQKAAKQAAIAAKKKKEEKLAKNKEKRERLEKKLAAAKDDKERARLQAKLDKANKKNAELKAKLAKTEKKLAEIKQKIASTKAKQAERKAKAQAAEKKVAEAKAKAVAHTQAVQKRKEERKKAEAKKARF